MSSKPHILLALRPVAAVICLGVCLAGTAYASSPGERHQDSTPLATVDCVTLSSCSLKVSPDDLHPALLKARAGQAITIESDCSYCSIDIVGADQIGLGTKLKSLSGQAFSAPKPGHAQVLIVRPGDGSDGPHSNPSSATFELEIVAGQ